jgi:hypothetical protein
MCTPFKVALLNGDVDFGTGTARTYKFALYTNAATLSAATAAYTATGEVSGTGYTAGGETLTVSQVPTSSGTTAFIDFSDVTWTTATITARGGLIYEDGGTNLAVAVLNFGEDKTSSGGDFVVTMPAADATNAIVRVA